jgi:hypothetical protein
MTTSQFSELPLDRPGALIAALPAVLGFAPERSLVLVTLDRGELGCVLRIDLSADMTAAVAHLAEVAASACPDAAIAVLVDEQGAACRPCNDDYADLTGDLGEELAAYGIELLAAHVVDRVAGDGQWHCADGCGRGGTVDDPWASPLAAAAVLDGRRLYPRRADLTAVVAADPVRAAALAPLIVAPASALTDAQARASITAARTAAARVAEGGDLTDDEAAVLGAALTDLRVRDTLYAFAVGADAGRTEALWAVLSRILPLPWRTEALVLLAFSAYARGDGPLAGVSLDAALRGDESHRMAGMLDQALQSGLRPEVIRELAQTGFRLAEQLGVALPPPRRFGRPAC